MMPDFDNVLHLHSAPVGEYALATNETGQVDTIVREFNMTVGQMVKKFGLENCSPTVRDCWVRGNIDQWIQVQHIIEPNSGKQYGKADNRNMKFVSCYYEANKQDTEMMLSSSGFNRFPVLASRWEVNGNDVYGTGPGHDALADIKEAQFFKARRAMAIDYQTNPPLQAPGILRSAGTDRFPGGITYVDSTSPDNAIRSLFDVRLDLSHLDESMAETLALIKSHFYEDLFLMMANDTRSGITATEVAERHEEKLLMLGPVLERLHNELFDPLINYTFDRMVETDILPEPPEAMQGKELAVQYISTLAQAQRAVGLQSFDRLIATVGAIAGAKQDPAVWDKVDTDQIIDEYADGLGTAPSVIRSDDAVAALRADRAAQEQAMQAAAAAEQMANTAKTVGDTDAAGVQDVMGMFSGYGSPTSTELSTI
jgi:hypothetical protein